MVGTVMVGKGEGAFCVAPSWGGEKREKNEQCICLSEQQ